METLEHNETRKDYKDLLQELGQKIENIQPVSVTVSEDFKNEAVVLKIGGNSLYLTVKQARDLSLEIRKASSLVEKDMMERGIKVNRKRHKEGTAGTR